METRPESPAGMMEILDGMNAPAVEWSADGSVLYANPAFLAITGHEMDELIGKHFYTVVFPGALADQWDMPRLDFIRLKAAAGHVTELFRKDGGFAAVSWTTILRASHEGKLKSILGIGLDVTSLARAQQELRFLADTLAKSHGLIAAPIGCAHDVD